MPSNALTGNVDVQVMQANKAIEVRVAGVNKGTFAGDILAEGGFDFVLAIGDDKTDEDLFAVLPDWAYSIKVGGAHSHAKYNCRDVGEVHRVLSMLTAVSHEEEAYGGTVTRALQSLVRFTKGLGSQ